jgi:L-lactate dehydrogenase complex protein LldF
VQAAAAGLDHLPRFMIYNPFNAWGKQRELPATPALTFREWYLKHRGAKVKS